ncbi:acetylglutamate kinase [Candidatus Woesearchaeota archaeon]|nr:acetylglutamate kinase [Candidatus Woesearchaeota archaeon]
MKQYHFLLDFFNKVGEQREALMYLTLYKKTKEHQFAVIKIGGAVLHNSIDKIAETIAYIYQLGLYPVLIHGGGPQIEEELSKNRINSKKINGQRITTEKELPVILSVMKKMNIKLVNKINLCNGEAISFTEDIFEVEDRKHPELGFVGDIKKVNTQLILNAINQKKIPVITPIGVDKNGQKYNINADCAAKHLITDLNPKKFILITSAGGILDKDKKIISYINMQEYKELLENNVINEGMLLKIQQIKELLDITGNGFSVQITSPENLIKELFTIKGSGTYIKKGSEINVFKSFNEIDKNKLKELLEKAFSKKLKDSYLSEDAKEIFLEKNYKGVIVIKGVNDVIYLDKFAVIKEFQGEGIGRDLWQLLNKKHKKIFWRAKPNNEVNDWYAKKSTSMFKFDNWHVYCINLGLDESVSAVDYALNREESFF